MSESQRVGMGMRMGVMGGSESGSGSGSEMIEE